MGCVPTIKINTTTGWVESFGFFLDSPGAPDLRVGACSVVAFLTAGATSIAVEGSTSDNLVNLSVPRGADVDPGAYTLVVRVIDPQLPADRYAFESLAEVSDLTS